MVLTRCMEGANREISPFQRLRPALAGAAAPARVRRDLALRVPARATLATVLSLHETGAIPASPRIGIRNRLNERYATRESS